MPQYTLDQALAQAGRSEQAGQFDQAESLYRAIVDQVPNCDAAMGKLAFLAYRSGRTDEAADWLRRAADANPSSVNHLGNLGVVLAAARRFREAVDVFVRALRLQPNNPDLHVNLGNVLNELKLSDQALEAYNAALRINPNLPDAWFNLGNTLWELGRYNESADAERKAVALRPDFADAHLSLGSALRNAGKMDEAAAAFRRSLELRPSFGEAHTGLAAVYQATGFVKQAVQHYRRAAEITDRPGVTDFLLVTLHLDPDSTPQSLHHEHSAWNHKFARPLLSESKPHPNDRSPDRRLRIGYVSAYLSSRPAGRFLLPLLSNHDHQSFEIVCYSDVRFPDAMTQTLRSFADLWRDTWTLDDSQLAKLVRDDRIDILIDLGMHTRGNRMLTFARKPAPVQATYLAYCSTTGLPTIDYRISDPSLDPTDQDQPFYSEKTVRLNSYWCYPPPDNAPDVNDLPALAAGHVTFGCLNDFCKVSDTSLELWGRIMRQLPASRLILHSLEGAHRTRVTDTLAKHAITPDRIQFVPMQLPAQYFATYHHIDIALDPTPWCGGTTTCDALYMGVPVVTFSGPTAISRGGASILSQLALTQWIATDASQYIQIATDLASNLPRLAEIRSNLRSQMLSSPLMNAPAFTRDFEDKLRTMWNTWCADQNAVPHL